MIAANHRLVFFSHAEVEVVLDHVEDEKTRPGLCQEAEHGRKIDFWRFKIEFIGEFGASLEPVVDARRDYEHHFF